MTFFSRPRRGFVLALGGLLILTAGLVGGTLFERNLGDGAIYTTAEDALVERHLSTKLVRADFQDACLESMISLVGDTYTRYVPRPRPADGAAKPSPTKSLPTKPELTKPVFTVTTLIMADRHFAIIRIEHFGENAEVAKKLQTEIYADRLFNREGLIVDLRGNPGGHVHEAAAVASAWVGQRLVCRLEDRHQRSKSYYGEQQAVLDKVPTAILVDGSTASAAEIFAGALQDYGLARLFGRITFGKGVATNTIDLGGDRSLVLVDNRWYTPKGRSVEHTGLVPEEVIAEPDANMCRVGSDDAVLDRAIAWLQAQTRR